MPADQISSAVRESLAHLPHLSSDNMPPDFSLIQSKWWNQNVWQFLIVFFSHFNWDILSQIDGFVGGLGLSSGGTDTPPLLLSHYSSSMLSNTWHWETIFTLFPSDHAIPFVFVILMTNLWQNLMVIGKWSWLGPII